LEVQSVRHVSFYSSHFIHRRRMCTCQHTAFAVVDRYILRRTQKRRRRQFRASASIFRFIRISLHNVVKRVRNRIARFRFDFGSTDGSRSLKELGEFRLGLVRLS
jgi:hypothetical protein